MQNFRSKTATVRVTLLHEKDEEDESVKIMFYLYFIPGVILSFYFLYTVTFLHVLHLKVKTEISLCMAIMLDQPWQSLYTQYCRTV